MPEKDFLAFLTRVSGAALLMKNTVCAVMDRLQEELRLFVTVSYLFGKYHAVIHFDIAL
jgi:hypothetical protein